MPAEAPPKKVHMVKTLAIAGDRDPVSAGLRGMNRDDIPGLGRLLIAAYSGTVDDEGETEQDAVAVVEATFEGEFGEFLGPASYVLEDSNHQLASASFVTLWRGQPLLAFSVTAPQHKGCGLAGKCIAASMTALAKAGYSALYLFVTPANASALALYRRLGFAAVGGASSQCAPPLEPD